MKTLLALIEKPNHVCYRIRVAAFAPYLQEQGWRIEATPLERSPLAFWRQLEQVRKADVVLLQRRLLNWWQLKLLRRASKRLLFDIDDAVFYRDSNNAKSHESSQRRRRFAALVQSADAVLAGNHFLADQATRCGGRAVYFPTVVDASLGANSQPSHLNRDLVWIGSHSTMTSLLEMQPGLAEATRRFPDLRLRVICDIFPNLPGVNVVPIVWTEAGEFAEVAAGGLGLSWLPEHPWSLGKCGLKVLHYMNAGLPVLANPYGVHHEQVIPGVTGFLAKSPLDWADAITRWRTEPGLAQKLGEAGRRKLVSEYSVEGWRQRLLACLKSESQLQSA